MENARQPGTLQEALVYYADPQRAFDAAIMLRWPDGNVTCPRCNTAKHSFIKTRRLWFCYTCQKQFTLKVGTIFEDSPLGLDKWLVAIWSLANTKNGTSSYELGRTLGVRQNTAWFMLHRIREAMKNTPVFKLGGSGNEVETDESYIRGKAANMHKDRKVRLQRIRGQQLRGDVYLGKTAVRVSLTATCGRCAASLFPLFGARPCRTKFSNRFATAPNYTRIVRQPLTCSTTDSCMSL